MEVVFVVIGLLLASLPPCIARCELEDVQSCAYTVHCTGLAGRISNIPSCTDDEKSAVFKLTDINLKVLTAGFFGQTNFDSQVTKLIVEPGSQIYTLSESCLRYFTRAKIMKLSGINIEDIKNEAFKDLVNLVILDLSHNHITKVEPYTFYLESDSYYSSLLHLDLSYNFIKHIPDYTFKFVKKIETLTLNNNKLVTISEKAFGSLSAPLNIKSLFLQKNQIVGLNLTLHPLKELQVLDLSNNNISILSAQEINRLNNLTIFNASYNFLETLESNSFNQAFEIQEIDLQHNKIFMPIKTIMFINCNKLKYLDLSYNNIISIEEESFLHNVLNYINFKHNNISGTIKQNTFVGLRGIKDLDLSGQDVTSLDHKAFSSMINMKHLNLSRNHITSIQNDSFEGSDSLNILDLSKNEISDLIFLKNNLNVLKELYLNNNNVSEINTGDFQNQTSLLLLNLANNKIIKIEPFALPLLNLQYLILHGNKLEGVIKKNTFSPAKYLRYLDLSNCRFSEVSEEAFVDMHLLNKLNLSHNAIVKIDHLNFKSLDNMYSLDLSYNDIDDIQFIDSSFESLLSIYLNNNNLESVSDAFKNAQKLIHLDLSVNKIKNVTNLVYFPKLAHLDLSHNEVTVFNVNCTDLKVLDVSSNKVKDIDLSKFNELVEVYLSNNTISHIDQTQFVSLAKVIYLDLSRNLIEQIPIGMFKDLTSTQYFNISHNKITDLSYGSMTGFKAIVVCDLSYNEIRNLEVDIFHECSNLTKLIIDNNFIDFIDVNSLQANAPNLELVSIGGNPVSCKQIVRLMKGSNHKNINITSIDKVYHEDNVYGIKCGTNILETTSSRPVVVVVHQWSSTFLTCLLVLVLICFAVSFGYKYYKKRNLFIPNNVIASRNLMELNNECDGDTL